MHKRHVLLGLGAWLARPAWALYDPQPLAPLVPALGAWRGTLTYADYQRPDRQVTLQTRVVVSLAGPAELSLYYVFDDGPGKTVYSYERMALDPAQATLTWHSGVAKPSTSRHRITRLDAQAAGARIEFERNVEAGLDRHVWELDAQGWSLTKFEVRSDKADLQRNRYAFTRQPEPLHKP